MEVHHHPHLDSNSHGRKKFKEYFLEFIMIFLAVTLGFFAESLREHINDNEKSEQYIQSLVEDLESDTARMNDIIGFDAGKINALNDMYQCYDTVTNNLRATGCMGDLIKYSKVNRPFLSNDRTVTLLANAGGFRLLAKEDADSILAYENMYREVHDFENTVYQQAQDNVRNTLNELANFKVVSPLENVSSLNGTDTGRSSLNGPLLFSDNRILLNKWFNQLQLYLRVTKAQSSLLHRLKGMATSLITFYQNNHHLK
ncbi:MAG: hypothetical protein ACTHNG_05300 [Ginsengibacter sp.]